MYGRHQHTLEPNQFPALLVEMPGLWYTSRTRGSGILLTGGALTASTLSIVRLLAYALAVASLVPLILTVIYYGRSRRASYYALRSQALRSAKIAALVAIALLFIAFLLLVVAPIFLVAEPEVVAITPTPSPTDTTQPSPMSTATEAPTSTPTPLPTATAPFIPTFTPSVQPPPRALSPLPSAVPAGVDARIQIMALAMEIDDDGQPVEPDDRFPDGQHPIYVSFQYGGMAPGVATTFAWYSDGVYFEPCSDTWAWALVEGREWGTRGGAAYECTPPEGWSPGRYEVRVFIETRLQGVASFVVE